MKKYKMEKEIDKKLEDLCKYIPFINYIANMDKEKYKKFLDIKSWIISKRRFPISDLLKIEQSFIVQYKNLFLEDVKVPEEIRKIFAVQFNHQYVNLCSDDENEEPQISEQKAKNKSDDDDGLAIVDILFPTTSTSKQNTDTKPSKIVNDISTYNGTSYSNYSEEKKLFKRRLDILNEERELQNAIHKFTKKKKKASSSLIVTETISLDSSASEDDSTTVVSNESTVESKHANIQKNNAVSNNTRKEEQDIAVSVDTEDGNNKNSKNISNVTNRFADENEVDNNQSISNSSHPQPLGDPENMNIEELLKVFDSLREGKPLEKFLLRLLEFYKNQKNLNAIADGEVQNANMNNEGFRANVQTPEVALGNTSFLAARLQEQMSPNNGRKLIPPAPSMRLNSNAFHQFQDGTGDMYAGRIPNDNQFTITTNVPPPPLAYYPNLNQPGVNIPGSSYPIQRKLNMNDPRILRELKRIQNSPLVSNIARNTAANLQRSIPQLQFPLGQTQIPTASWPNYAFSAQQLIADNSRQEQALGNNYMYTKYTDPNVSKTYLEHKRRKAEKERERETQSRIAEEKQRKKENEERQRKKEKEERQQKKEKEERQRKKEKEERQRKKEKEERQRKKEKDAKEAAAAQEIEKREFKKQQDQIISILHGHENEVQTLWNAYKRNTESSTNKVTDEIAYNSQIPSGKSNQGNNSPAKHTSLPNALPKATNATIQSPHPVSTVKAKDEKSKKILLNDPQMMNESKQSSQSTIAKKANNKINQSSPPRSAAKANTGDYILKSLIGKRRSSVHARDIISRQLNDSDSSVDSSSTSTINKRKRQRQSDVKKVVRPLRIEDFSDSDVDNSTYQEKLNKTFKRIKKLQPIVKLQRLETEQRLKQQNPFQELSKLSQIGIASNEQKKLDVQLVETRCTPVEIDQNKKLTAKVGKCCRRNNDCQMTELNTRFCILCTAKPADLTYHYIRKHKTESYVSRLTWTQLDDLLVRTNFAELQKSPNNHPARYKVTCIFCELVLIQPFMSLYDHYSKHTGEYAYTCTNCSFIKPFRADILSHQLNSKNCRRANLKIMYRYPPNTMVIHLHYCSICNYVQLNKANVLKHLREQHSTREAVDSNVSKCILTAIQIAADTQACESTSNLTNMESKLNDTKTDDAGLQKTPLCGLNEISDELDEEITVCNEPCPEEIEIDDHIKKLKFFENQVIQNSLSLTETDCPINSNGSIAFAKISSTSMEQHPTQLKCEELDVSDMDVVPLTQFSEKSEPTLNESPLRYRAFPENFTYLGLYKCMADDCYFSTDEADQMLSHLNDHANSECPPVEYLQCAYCVLRLGDCNTAQELVNHIQLKHQHDVYQCSLCSYRSCDASNVSIHQLLRHPYTPNDCFIYMCANQEITCEPTNSYLMMRKAESVQKITCPYCTTKFFATNHLKKHLEIIHKMANIEMDVLKTYSCIYCPTSDRDQKSIRIHLAIHHPGEFPFMCNHNTTEDSKVDSLQSLKLVNLADAVPPHLLKDVSGYKVTDNALEQREIEQLDIKPDIMLLNEETAKVRLRKLTEFTGVSPENLFRCPESACGGFFSLYELWLRHMKARHCALICSCPHCSNTNQYNSDREMLALTDFEAHFETHRGHVYICFHCLDTFKYEDQVRSHAEIAHQLSEIRLERICYNFPYTYKVLIHSTLYTERVMFLSELLKLLEKKLKELEEENLKKLKRQWLVPTTTDWLENFPSHLYCRELTKKCLEEGCKYLSTSDDLLFNHVRNVHKISGHSFLCKQCPFRIVNCHSWEPIFEHLKVHTVSNLYICCVCSFHHRSRNSLMDHIRREHDARDAPFVQIREINKSLFIELAIVFAVGEICFSTIRNCFCCEERSMKVDALALHLKYYHKLRLDYYCQRCFVHLDGLQTCDNHFKEEHLNMKRKIYCTLAYDANIAVTSIQPFQICLHKAAGIVPPIKSEPKDENEEDSVFVLEDDDIAIAKNMHERSLCGADKPVVKCVSTENLLKPPSANPLTNDFVPIRIMNGSTIQIPGEFPNPFINVHQRHNIP